MTPTVNLLSVSLTPSGHIFPKICTDCGVVGGNLPPVPTTPTAKETETERKKDKRDENGWEEEGEEEE